MGESKAGSPIIGVDLGTTNSLVAIVRDGLPSVLPTAEGHRLIPSVIAVSAAGGGAASMVGMAAKPQKLLDAKRTAFSVKRLLGRTTEEVRALGDLPYEIIDRDGQPWVRLGDRDYRPVELSAVILAEAKRAAEFRLGQPVSRAVITVPAYFNDSQRQATRTAGRLAGLEVVRIINEPTAAALAYGLDRKREGLIAVYDLGGGTFDISILRLQDGIFEVLSTHGDTRLGGDDLDQALFNAYARELEAEGYDVRAEAARVAALLDACERAKIALSENPRAEVSVALPGRADPFRRELTREQFADLVRPILDRTRVACEHALQDAGITPAELSDVVLVGGPTRLTAVRDTVRAIFGREPNGSMHPDEVVALGAAIQADIIGGGNRDLLLLDVVPLSLGIETYGGLMSVLIARNAKIPTSARETFTTFADRQTAVDIHVLQGEREQVAANRSLARFKLRGIAPQPAGIPRIEVTFLIDADGILQVAARDLKTGLEQSIEVRPSFGLSEAEVAALLANGTAAAEADRAFRALVEARNEAEPILRATEKNLASATRLVGEAEAARIASLAKGLRDSLAGSDTALIREMSFKVSSATEKLAQAVVDEAIRNR